MITYEVFVRRLAQVLLAGPFEAVPLGKRAQSLLPRKRGWTQKLGEQLARYFSGKRRPRQRDLERLLASHPLVGEAFEKDSLELRPLKTSASCFVAPTQARFAWPVPRWNTVTQLCDWMQLEPAMFDWLCDRKGLERFISDEPLRNYRYQWIRKRGGRARLIEAPKPVLKNIQRRLLDEVFSFIPTHEAAHGFCRSRSIKSFVSLHCGQNTVLRMDLKDFFPSINPCRFRSLLMTCGYAEEVAETLTSFCVNRVPTSVFSGFPFPENWQAKHEQMVLLRQAHFPQGAPTSPHIANVCAYRFDCRLSGLAQWAGVSYARYADDLLFSGDQDFARRADKFAIYVGAIALEEGFEVNTHKTRVMSSSTRQSAGGVVLNQKPQTPRRDYDLLRAILHRCVVNGPSSENREQVPNFRDHLAGRVAYVGQWNSARAIKLQALWEQIDWSR